jgi:predicted protein tyrosine phosphatase
MSFNANSLFELNLLDWVHLIVGSAQAKNEAFLHYHGTMKQGQRQHCFDAIDKSFYVQL